MSIRLDTLRSKLARFLERFSAPAKLSEQAQLDEAAGLLRAIDRAAPQNGYEQWWATFEDVLVASLKTRAWPTIGEVSAAAAKVPQPRTAVTAQAQDWREFAAQYQLRKWVAGLAPIPPQFVTKRRLYDIGLDSAHVERCLAFIANPANHGIL